MILSLASPKPVNLMGLILVAAAALLAGGCGLKPTHVEGVDEFKKIVLDSDQPVLVDFWKWGCLSCMFLDPGMDTLTDEYRGRAVVAKFMAENFVFIAPTPEINNRYDLALFPTVVLFHHGHEVKRWIWNSDLNKYRKALDEALGIPPAEPKKPADKPAKAQAVTAPKSPTTQKAAGKDKPKPPARP